MIESTKSSQATIYDLSNQFDLMIQAKKQLSS